MCINFNCFLDWRCILANKVVLQSKEKKMQNQVTKIPGAIMLGTEKKILQRLQEKRAIQRGEGSSELSATINGN